MQLVAPPCVRRNPQRRADSVQIARGSHAIVQRLTTAASIALIDVAYRFIDLTSLNNVSLSKADIKYQGVFELDGVPAKNDTDAPRPCVRGRCSQTAAGPYPRYYRQVVDVPVLWIGAIHTVLLHCRPWLQRPAPHCYCILKATNGGSRLV